jgi:hypothetical protein
LLLLLLLLLALLSQRSQQQLEALCAWGGPHGEVEV